MTQHRVIRTYIVNCWATLFSSSYTANLIDARTIVRRNQTLLELTILGKEKIRKVRLLIGEI